MRDPRGRDGSSWSPGTIITISSEATRPDWGAQYVRDTLVKNLQTLKIELPASNRTDMDTVSMEELGIQYPVLVDPQVVTDFTEVNPYTGGGPATPGGRARSIRTTANN